MVHQIGVKLRGQIQIFSGKLCAEIGKVAGRFVEEMIYGIQARGSAHLSEIARSLLEKTSVKKRIDRLSRNLARAGLGDEISAGILAEGAGRIERDTLLIVDPTDIAKKYAKKMGCLARVRDGSEKKQSEGYWVDTVVGARPDSSEIIPLVHRLYSQNAGDFVSENHELLDVIRKVYRATEGRGVFVVDRGGDRRTLYKDLLNQESPVRFIIRQRGDRHLLCNGKLRETFELAERCKTPYAQTVIKQKDGKEKAFFIQFGFCPVRVPEHPEKPLWLVVVKGFGEKPLMLLTTEPMSRNRKILWWIVQAYLTRWRVEDTIRFIKQSYNLEDIRRIFDEKVVENVRITYCFSLTITLIGIKRLLPTICGRSCFSGGEF
ncbi:MAG: hypothetical protein ACLQPD_22645 [Desulfomonilaceae bacterium]